MKVYETELIRNIGVVGHGDSGKTSLLAAMLFRAGAVNRLGRVEDGTTPTDYDDDEIQRKITLYPKLAFVEWNKCKLNLLDTPGYRNFIHGTEAALSVADSALVVVDAVSGVEVQTEKVWEFCDRFNLPRAIFINKLDRDNASFQRALDSVHEIFGKTAIPVHLPIGHEKTFHGMVDLLRNKAYLFDLDTSGKYKEVEVPGDMADEVAAAREALIEKIAEGSESLMEKFFDEGTLSETELTEGMQAGILSRAIIPVLCGAATANIGATQVLDFCRDYLPSPAARTEIIGKDPKNNEVKRATNVSAPMSAFVFRTVADPFAGRITLLRIYSGVLKSDSTIFNAVREKSERLATLQVVQGKTMTPVSELRAGDLGAVVKLKETLTGDTLTDPAHPIIYAAITAPEPAISFAIEPKSRGDEEKIGTSMARIIEEDQAVRYTRDLQTKELLIAGQGQTHVEVTVEKLKKRYGVEVLLHQPKVPYRETIRKKAEVQGRHKKQTGGHGQFGDCWIKMEPLPRGKDYEFVDDISGGSIPRNFIPAVEKGIIDAREKGILAGFPVVDFRVILFDGSYHPVDSSEIAFKIAGSVAFKKALEQADPVLLEPIMNVEIYAPEEYSGDIMGDLNSRRGRIQGMDVRGRTQVIRSQVPMAEMLSYAPVLTSMTGGRGNYHMEFSHYDEVPAHLAQKIIDAAKKEKEEQEK
jgi:elongation factor G